MTKVLSPFLIRMAVIVIDRTPVYASQSGGEMSKLVIPKTRSSSENLELNINLLF